MFGKSRPRRWLCCAVNRWDFPAQNIVGATFSRMKEGRALANVQRSIRVCELLALQWDDIDFGNLTVKIQRSIVGGEINPTKTEASESSVPLDPDLAEALLQHRARVVYSAASDYVFAGATGKPPWKDSILADHLKPAATKAGIGNIGWHTFRHTYSTLLHSLGATPAVQKELLRHADIRTTLDIYTHAVSDEKREAASKLAQTLWKK
jgi:integrase